MRNEHKFNPTTGRCDMSHMLPNNVIGQPETYLGQTKTVKALINHRSIVIGHVTPCRDEHGNTRYLGTSSILPDKEVYWRVASAIEFWLFCIAQVHAK